MGGVWRKRRDRMVEGGGGVGSINHEVYHSTH